MINKKVTKFDLNSFLANRKLFSLAIAFIAGSILIIFLAAYPQFKQISTLNTKLKKEEEKLTKLVKKANELAQFKESEAFAQTEKVDEVLPSNKPLLELINNLNSIASENRIIISDLRINPGLIATDAASLSTTSKKQKGDGYDTLELEMTAAGTLGNIENFISLVERISPLTTITQISLKRTDIDNSDSKATAKLSMKTYYFTQSIQTTLESPLPKITQKEKDAFQEIVDFLPDVLEDQHEIQGGGTDDLFGIEWLKLNQTGQ
jgi:hypothetical protein